MPCSGSLHLSDVADYAYSVCHVSGPHVGPSVLVCDVEHTALQFALCCSKFVLCLVGQFPCIRAIHHNKLAAHMSLQADDRLFLKITRCLVMPPSMP